MERWTRQILRENKLRAVKGLGQNFLINADTLKKIVEAAQIERGEKVLEIGAGLGTLTRFLLKAGANVTAVEIDKKLAGILNKTLGGNENFTLIEGDVLKINLAQIMGSKYKVVASLPYYITTQIMMKLMEENVPKIVTMVQREVAERMTARPCSRIYGALSVAVQSRYEARIAFEVSPENFLPRPTVTSAVVVCTSRPCGFEVDENFTKVVRAAFAWRRKTLLNALSIAGFDREKILKLGQDCQRRAETLSLEEFASLAKFLKE